MFWKKEDAKKKKSPLFKRVNSFSKIITVFWLFAWLEIMLFSQIATLFTLGDATSIQYMHENVRDIGMIVCSFYFSTKCVENVAKGYEEWKTNMIEFGIESSCDVDLEEGGVVDEYNNNEA